MALPLPKAFWPVTVIAGVNDKIHFMVGATKYEATVAPGTYYSLKYTGQTPPEDTSLGHAIAVAMDVAELAQPHERL
jgi:hypothetical protein